MGQSSHEIELKLRFDDEAAAARLREQLDPEGAVTACKQTNHFFDAAASSEQLLNLQEAGKRALPWLLRSASIGLRLRKEEERDGAVRWFLTCKGPAAKERKLGGGSEPVVLTVRPEEEITLEPDVAEAVIEGREDPLDLLRAARSAPVLDAARAALGDKALTRVGAFVNERWRLPYDLPLATGPFRVELELDRTVFPGEVVHHELELELEIDEVPGGQAALPAVEEALAALLRACGTEGRPSRGKASRFFEALAFRPE